MGRSKRKASFARLSPLAKGRIIGMREQGAKREVIQKLVKKKDGTAASLRTIDSVLERFNQDPLWDGTEQREAGYFQPAKRLRALAPQPQFTSRVHPDHIRITSGSHPDHIRSTSGSWEL